MKSIAHIIDVLDHHLAVHTIDDLLLAILNSAMAQPQREAMVARVWPKPSPRQLRRLEAVISSL